MSDRGNWVQTFTGRQFWPLDPRPEDVCIEDIAHALALTSRFGGHCREPYSVAQHSVLVSRFVAQRNPEHALCGLLHDAAEAYVGDMVAPIKRQAQLAHYRRLEDRVLRVILDRFGVFPSHADSLSPIVRRADLHLLATEARDFMAPPPESWGLWVEPLAERIHPWSWRTSEKRFLEAFDALGGFNVPEGG